MPASGLPRFSPAGFEGGEGFFPGDLLRHSYGGQARCGGVGRQGRHGSHARQQGEPENQDYSFSRIHAGRTLPRRVSEGKSLTRDLWRIQQRDWKAAFRCFAVVGCAAGAGGRLSIEPA